jgi:hypothetical protein
MTEKGGASRSHKQRGCLAIMELGFVARGLVPRPRAEGKPRRYAVGMPHPTEIASSLPLLAMTQRSDVIASRRRGNPIRVHRHDRKGRLLAMTQTRKVPGNHRVRLRSAGPCAPPTGREQASALRRRNAPPHRDCFVAAAPRNDAKRWP